MFAYAGKPDVSGLFVSLAYAYWWATGTMLSSDPKRIEDVDVNEPDHAVVACCYGLQAQTLVRAIQVNGPLR